jgi:peptidoglycan/LPS O-acetylase OafA/YrhL
LLTKQNSIEIDALRGLATLGVIWGHSMYSMNMPVELNGAFWVWIFFSLSGFFIGEAFIDGKYKLSAKGYFSFLWNRFLRILPLYYTALCLGLLFEFIAAPDKINAMQVIRQFLFISPLNSTTLSGPLWALAVIIKFYILSIFFIWIITIVNHEKRLILLLSLLVFSIIISALYIKIYGDNFVQPRTLLGNLHFFIWGMLLSVINWERLPRISSIKKFYAIFILILIAWYLNNWELSYFWGLGRHLSNYVSLSGGSLCALSIVFIIMLREPGDNNGNAFKTENIFIKSLAWCGFYSYAIYVWHSVLIKSNQLFFHQSPGINFLVYLLLSLPVSFLSYKIIESPLQQFRVGETASHFSKKHK